MSDTPEPDVAAAKKATAKKTTKRTSERKPKEPQQKPQDFRLEFTHKGVQYEISPNDLTAVESRDFRREMGVSLAACMQSGDVDIDVIATLVWLVDRRDNPTLTWERVAGDFTYDDVIADFGPPGDDGGDSPSD